jgi:hypothetical protein
MSRIATFSAVATLAAASLIGSPSPASAGDVSIGIHIGTPPPPAIVVAPGPPVVVVPASPPPVVVASPPVLVIAPGAPMYFHAGHYFRFYNGVWFVAEWHEGPWFFMPAERVPQRVLALPAAYNRMHPSHATVVGPHPWHEREHGHGHGHGHDGHDGRD